MGWYRDATGMSLGTHWDAAEAQRRVLSNIYSNANIDINNYTNITPCIRIHNYRMSLGCHWNTTVNLLGCHGDATGVPLECHCVLLGCRWESSGIPLRYNCGAEAGTPL